MAEYFQKHIICNLPAWLSAIGTLSAVIVALYFSRKRGKISCIIDSNISKIFEEDKLDPLDVISITIVNTGTRAFAILSIYWQWGFFKKKLFFQPPTLSEYSTKLPLKISDGDEVNIYIPIKIFLTMITNDSSHYFKKYFFIKKYSLKIMVYTSTKKKILKRVGKSITNEIKSILETA
jgi:hypothetical protein